MINRSDNLVLPEDTDVIGGPETLRITCVELLYMVQYINSDLIELFQSSWIIVITGPSI